MSDVKVLITDEDIDRALEDSKSLPPQALALSAAYDQRLDVIVLQLDNGQRLVIPREQMQGLENATETQLTEIQIFSGVDIAWPQLNVDHYLPYLLEGRYASDKWKAARQKAVAA